MPTILTSADFDEVRQQIDTSLDDSDVSNPTIGMDTYQGRAEDWVIGRDANALNYLIGGSSPNATKAKYVRRAAVYYLAALLCPVVPAIKRDKFGQGDDFERVPFNAEKRAAELFALADGAMDAYLEAQPQAVQLPTVFTLAQGRRGL